MSNTRTRTNRLLAEINPDAPAKIQRPEMVPASTIVRLPDGYDGEGNAMWMGETLVVLVDVTTVNRLHLIEAGSHLRMPRGIRVMAFDEALKPTLTWATGTNVDSVAAWHAARELLFFQD